MWSIDDADLYNSGIFCRWNGISCVRGFYEWPQITTADRSIVGEMKKCIACSSVHVERNGSEFTENINSLHMIWFTFQRTFIGKCSTFNARWLRWGEESSNSGKCNIAYRLVLSKMNVRFFSRLTLNNRRGRRKSILTICFFRGFFIIDV